MPTHDCKNCRTSGECPIESIAPWLNEHESDAISAKKDCADSLAVACARLVFAYPPIMQEANAVVGIAETCFMLGYHKGRTYQDVPEVFKRS